MKPSSADASCCHDTAHGHQHGHAHHHGHSPQSGELPPPTEIVYMGLPHERYLRPRLWVAVVLGVPVLGLAMGEMLFPADFH